MDERPLIVQEFLDSAGWKGSDVNPLAGDASARRYFRLIDTLGDTAVLMDAPNSGDVEIGAFVNVAKFLSGLGLSAPRIFAADANRGFVLMEDLGDAQIARLLVDDPDAEYRIYSPAVDVLVELDSADPPDFLKSFDSATMAQKTRPAFEWYSGALQTSSNAAINEVIAELEKLLKKYTPKTKTVLLRDFHAENLIWLPDRKGLRQVGLLDFQDAMVGPPGYDLVSLLQDARRDVSPASSARMIARFCAATKRDEDAFKPTYFSLGAQRSLRIIGVFARLCIAYGKPQYVDLIPRVWGHLKNCLAQPELQGLDRLLRSIVPEPTPENLQRLKAKCPPRPIL